MDEKIKALPLDKVTLFFVNEIEAAQILGQKELESTQEAAAASAPCSRRQQSSLR